MIGKPEDHIALLLRNSSCGFKNQTVQIPAIFTAACGVYAISSIMVKPGRGSPGRPVAPRARQSLQERCCRMIPGPPTFAEYSGFVFSLHIHLLSPTDHEKMIFRAGSDPTQFVTWWTSTFFAGQLPGCPRRKIRYAIYNASNASIYRKPTRTGENGSGRATG